MLKRLKYIFMTLLLTAALQAAGQSYVIDSVCVGTTRHYRIDGEKLSTYLWKLYDQAGNTVTLTNAAGTPFAELAPEKYGSELEILWNQPGIFRLEAIQYSEFGCDTLQQGTVKVFDQPVVFPGNPIAMCAGTPVLLAEATASNFSQLKWTTSGDGTFSSTTVLNPVYTPGPNDILAGIVALTITAEGLGDSGSCTEAVGTVTVTISNMKLITTQTNLVCFEGADGAISTLLSGATGSVTYSWTGPNGFASSQTNLTGLAAGTYTLTVTDQINCTVSATVTLTQPTPITITEIHVDSKCKGKRPGSIDLTVSGGTPGSGYQFLWVGTDGFTATTEDISDLVGSVSYTITVTDANGCTATSNIFVDEEKTMVLSETHVDVKCSGDASGSIDLTVDFGKSPYTYLWTNLVSTIATTEDLSNLPAGFYRVTVTDANDCTETLEVTLTETAKFTALATGTDVKCFGGNDGTAKVVVSGGAGTPVYAWTGPNGFTSDQSDLTGLIAGTYSVTVTDINGCSSSASVTINQPALQNLVITNPVAVCEPATVDLTASSVTAGSDAGLTFTYWTDAAGTTTLTTPNAVSVSGTYYIKATNAAGCPLIKPVIVTINPLPKLVITDPAAVCEPATVDLTAASVTAGSDAGVILTYWTDVSGTTTLTNQNSVSVSGTYYIKASTAAGCSVILPVKVTINPLPNLVITDPAAVCEPSTIDLTTAAITTGSDAGLTYTYWTDAGGTTTLTTPTAVSVSGIYFIKGTNSSGCSVIKPVNVTIRILPNLAITNPPAVCEPSTVDLTASSVTTGSDAGLTFTYWTDAGGTATLTNPAAVAVSGTYYIKASTAADCSVIKEVKVTINSLPSFIISDPAVVCEPTTVDLTLASVTYGSDPGLVLSYWTDAVGTTALANPVSVSVSGFYYIKAVNANGCSVIKAVKVTVHPLPNLVINDPAEVCEPSTVDLTTLSVTTGSGAGLSLTYWTDANGTIPLSNPASVSVSGTYYIKAVAATGCFVIKPVNVVVNPLPNLVITDPAPVCEPGTIDLTAASITAGSDAGVILTYWTDAAGTTTLTNQTSVSVSGNYYIKATTAAGCSVIRPVKVTINPLPILVITDPAPICEPGTIDLSAASVTTGSDIGLSLTYWTDASGTTSLTSYTSVSVSGTYYIKATNALGCSVIKPVKVTISPLPNLVITDPAEVCFPATVDLTAASVTTGSDLSLNLTYWTDAAGTATLTTPAAVAVSGTYYIKATSLAGCSVIKPVKVTINPLPILVITDPAPVCEPGTINLTDAAITAGSDPGLIFTYWTDAVGTVTLTNQTSVAVSGTYYIKATTAKGCSVIKPVKVTINPLPVLVITDPAPVCEPGTINLTDAAITSGSDLNLTFTYWTDAAGTSALTNSTAVALSGTYYIKATNTFGCFVIKPVKVTISPLPNLVVTNPAAVCEPSVVDLTAPSVTAGSDTGLILTYWTNSGGTATLTNPASVSVSGTYYIKASTAAGCSVIKPVTVIINPLPNLVITDPAPICEPATINLANASITAGSDPNLTFTYWTDAGGTTTLTNYSTVSVTGTYYIKATNSLGCSVIKPVKVIISPLPKLVITDPAAVCFPATIDLTAISITAGSDVSLNLTYWTDAGGTTTLTNYTSVSVTGTYYIKATNIAGCSVIKPVKVIINPLPILVITNPEAVCEPTKVNLTASSITAGSDPGLTFTYWTDAAATAALSNFTSVSINGTYYIKATNAAGCFVIQPVKVTINPLPILVIIDPAPVCEPGTVNLASSSVTAGSDPDLTFTYWTNAIGTTTLTNHTSVALSGTYYIKATNVFGCSVIRPVKVSIGPLPNLVINDPAPVCEPATINLAASAVTAGSEAGLTLSYWTDPLGTDPLTNYTAVAVNGFYYIKATAASGCPIIKPVKVTIYPLPRLVITDPEPVCEPSGVDLTAASVTAGSGLGLTFTYWTNAAGTVPLPNYTAVTVNGTYYIKATAATGCFVILPVNVVLYKQPLAFAGNPATICPGNTYNLAGATADNYSSLYWTSSGDGTFNDATLLHPTYTPGSNDLLKGGTTLKLTAQGLSNSPSCIPAVSAMTLTIIKLQANVAGEDVTCFGFKDGRIIMSNPSGGSGSYEYTIDGASWKGSPFINLASGIYKVQMRDALIPSCFAVIDTITIIEPEPLTATLKHTDPTCLGNDGTIKVLNPQGGSGSYEFSLDEITWPSGSFTKLLPGTYTVHIRDANAPDCKAIVGTIVLETPEPLTATVVPTHVSCFGGIDGKISISEPKNGSGTYEYSINGGAWSQTVAFNNLVAGNYTVRMRDYNAPTCMETIATLVIDQPEQLNASLVPTNVTCFGSKDGTISVQDPAGGSGNFEYTIDGINWTNTALFANLGPGNYQLQIRDANAPNCKRTLNNIVITEPRPLTAIVTSTDITCYGLMDGIIKISDPQNGIPNYQYTIDGSTWTITSSFTGLGPNTYIVQMRDANNCTRAIDTLKIIEPKPLYADVASTNETCLGNDGTITITNPANSISGLYEYSINGTNWTSVGLFTGLSSNTYTVSIRDANLISCERIIKTVTITEEEPLLALVEKTNVTCFGGNDGTLAITTAQGGSGLYEYSINGTSWQSRPFFDGLTASGYTLQMRDAKAITCQYTVGTYIITQPDKLVATTNPVHVTCYGASDGEINLTSPSGGSGTYEYSVNGIDWFDDKIENLKAGFYTVQIRDATVTSCVVSLAPVEIKQPEKLFANVDPTPVSCFGGSDGMITISDPINGVGPYQFSLDGGLTWQPEMIFTGLKANSYTLLVIQDANKCIATLDPVTVTQPAKIEASYKTTNETLPGANDGTVVINNQKGGSGVYEYSLDGTNWQSDPLFTGLAPATYDVWVGDANVDNCMIQLSVKILPAGSISAEYTIKDVTCYGGSDGSITFSNSSGATNYQYSITGGAPWQSGNTFTSLKAQFYTLAIRNADVPTNITVFGSFEIKQPEEVDATLSVTNETFAGANNGRITISNTTGGSSPYQYSINGTDWQTNPLFSGLTSGTYIVQIRDAAGCIIPIQKIIQPAGSLTAEVSHTNPLCSGDSNGSIIISNPTGGSTSYDYSIDGGTTWQPSGSYTGLSAGVYEVWLRDATTVANKVLLERVSITSPAKLRASYADFEPPLCTGGTGRVTITASGGTPGYSGIGTFQMAAGEERIFKVTDKNGCSDEFPFLMPNPEKIIATAYVIPPLCYGGEGTVIVSATGGTGKYGKTVGAFKVKAGTSYKYTVIDSNGCQSNVVSGVMLGAPPELVVTIAPVAPICPGNTAKVTVAASGGTPDINGNYTGTGIFYRPVGTHSFTVTDSNGCTSVGLITIGIKDMLAAPKVIVNAQPTCYIPTGTIEVTEPKGGTGFIYSMDGASYQFSSVFAGLAPGSTHFIKVKDGEGCESLPVSITIGPISASPLAPVATASAPDCNAPFGRIEVISPKAGTGSEYSFDGGAYSAVTTFNNLLPESSHTIRVRDLVTGCESGLSTVTIPPIAERPPAPFATATIPDCYIPFGTITVTQPEAGTGFLYSLNGGVYTGASTFFNLAPGSSHSIKIKDISTGCESAGTIVKIDLMPANPATPSATVTVNPTCDNPDGTVVVTNPVGSEYQYTIAGKTQTSVTFADLITGTYSITVRNAKTGCISIGSIAVPAIPPSPVITSVSRVNPKCYGETYTITLSMTNTPSGNYTIRYDGGQFNNVDILGGTATITGRLTESYKDFNNLTYVANGCTSSPTGVNVRIDNPKPLVFQTIYVTEHVLKATQKGAIDISVTGGTGTLKYLWSNGAVSQDLNDISYGTYTVVVTDANGCTVDKSIKIPLNNPPIALPDKFIAKCSSTAGNLLNDNGSGIDYDPDPIEQKDFITINIVPVINPKYAANFKISKDGSFIYDAIPGYSGTDVFVYEIADKWGQTATATVTIQIVADFDGDGVSDLLDPDADGDGILNILEALAGQDWKTADSDGDGHLNWLDIDSDNDGIVDNIESQTTPGYIMPTGKDTDADGIDDAYDTDQGGKVISPVDSDLTLTAEPDKIPDFLDVDSDNDLVPDYIEGHDLNADGKPDRKLLGKDTDADGLDDGYDDIVNGCNNGNATGAVASLQDFDGDGIQDFRDENDDDDQYLTRFEDLNLDGDFSNDDYDLDGHPEYLDYGRDCDLLIPDAFSPNGDNIHEYFQIYCINHYPNAKMYIFDQLGNKLYEKDHYGNMDFWGSADRAWWDGKTTNRSADAINGKVIPGTYYYVLNLGNGEVKKSYVFVSY
jgi:gliding motility-associated-like protein